MPILRNPLPPLVFGGIRAAAPTALAPMAALTDSVFRRMVKRQGGCGVVVSEMVAARAVLEGSKRALALLRFTDEERPIGGQLVGSDPAAMAEAARRLEAMGFDFVDVNMGCPARKVVHGGGGSAMMRDLPAAAAALAAMRRALSIPLTIKIRAGWSDDCLNAAEAARVGEDCGVQMVSVHARTRADQYRPGVRADVLAETKAAVRIPVLANGDIRTAANARTILAATGCDGVMVGRGAVADPWLLLAIATGDDAPPGRERARAFILDHFAILRAEVEPGSLLGKLKTFSGWYTRGLMGGAALRSRIGALRSADEFTAAVEEFFAAPGPPVERPAGGDPLLGSHQGARP